MTILESEKSIKLSQKDTLIDQYYWFNKNLFAVTNKAFYDFFQKKFNLRFMGMCFDENILFYGDEYFVNKVPVTKNGDFKVKISSSLIANLLDLTLGVSDKKFDLKKLTDIEAMLIKSFTIYLYNQIEPNINKGDVKLKALQNSKEYNLTFYVQNENKHIGKIIISLPDFFIGEIKPEEKQNRFEITDFKNAQVKVALVVGKSKIALNDIKAIEDGDLILLENSDINAMSVLVNGQETKFRIEPNPSLIVSIDNNGGNEMEEETSTKSQNMWDSILVDIVAEFDNVKLTLGELKQISEGLVIDVGSVYDNKVKLRVENQVVATGELVILNDRYGVKINSVKKSKETPKAPAKPANKAETQKTAPKEKPAPAKTDAKPAPKAGQKAEGDEKFDYSDFEIEDESI